MVAVANLLRNVGVRVAVEDSDFLFVPRFQPSTAEVIFII